MASAAFRHRNRAAVRLVTGRAGIDVRHVRESAGIRLAGVLVGDLRLGAVRRCARREIVDVNETEFRIGRIRARPAIALLTLAVNSRP